MWFDCSFLMTKAIEHLFMSLLAIHVSSLEKCLFKILAHFKNVLFVFLLLSCKSSLYTLDTSKFLIRCMICKYILFFHSLGCLFTFLMVSYEAYGFLMLLKSVLSISLLAMPLVSYLRNHCLNPVMKFYNSAFSSESYHFNSYP